MIVRIVRLTLHPNEREAFQALFDEVSTRIRGSAGCLELKLLEDVRHPNIVTTFSEWRDEQSLNEYRKSDFFLSTWSKTRKLFAAPPEAHSYTVSREL
ncbi:MAG: antibiotic biosynthesis monooxygenase [Rhodothermales bacterium]|nr:antibiotic biosynthesis monooxygenase [Rhodothermales bacterium]